MEPALSAQEAEEASRALEGKGVEAILAWALGKFGDGLGFMTALGYSGMILHHFLKKLKPDFESHFIDTGFHFPETLEFLERLKTEHGMRFVVHKSRASLDQLQEWIGPEPWKINPDLCCHYNKVAPLLRVIHPKKAWLSALRRDQSQSRSGIDIVELDGRGVVKVYPMADWTFERSWAFVREQKIPYHPLHDRNYPSVGCTHCTLPVKPGEHERAGRWNSMPKLECGIHVHQKKPE